MKTATAHIPNFPLLNITETIKNGYASNSAGKRIPIPYPKGYLSHEEALANKVAIRTLYYFEFVECNSKMFGKIIDQQKRGSDVSEAMKVMQKYWEFEHFFFKMISQRDAAIEQLKVAESHIKDLELVITERDEEIKKLITVIENT